MASNLSRAGCVSYKVYSLEGLDATQGGLIPSPISTQTYSNSQIDRKVSVQTSGTRSRRRHCAEYPQQEQYQPVWENSRRISSRRSSRSKNIRQHFDARVELTQSRRPKTYDSKSEVHPRNVQSSLRVDSNQETQLNHQTLKNFGNRTCGESTIYQRHTSRPKSAIVNSFNQTLVRNRRHPVISSCGTGGSFRASAANELEPDFLRNRNYEASPRSNERNGHSFLKGNWPSRSLLGGAAKTELPRLESPAATPLSAVRTPVALQRAMSESRERVFSSSTESRLIQKLTQFPLRKGIALKRSVLEMLSKQEQVCNVDNECDWNSAKGGDGEEDVTRNNCDSCRSVQSADSLESTRDSNHSGIQYATSNNKRQSNVINETVCAQNTKSGDVIPENCTQNNMGSDAASEEHTQHEMSSDVASEEHDGGNIEESKQTFKLTPISWEGTDMKHSTVLSPFGSWETHSPPRRPTTASQFRTKKSIL